MKLKQKKLCLLKELHREAFIKTYKTHFSSGSFEKIDGINDVIFIFDRQGNVMDAQK